MAMSRSMTQKPRKREAGNFLAGMVKSLPPLHDVAAMAGLELPKYLGDAKAAELPGANGQEK